MYVFPQLVATHDVECGEDVLPRCILQVENIVVRGIAGTDLATPTYKS